ncbi:glycosyltransferase family 92 protein [Alistipes indistinctus]|uniref:glycosyltransferase family 92 protein n=1 Tax=Alistipes indistinctus TaxID=626932 RepID=UPI0026DAFC79|nr:glycosyltransferase family 92 protein [Alistipes indistinctus]
MDSNLTYVRRGFFIEHPRKQTILKNNISRYVLAIIYSCIASILVHIRLRKKRVLKYKVCVCGIFKNEARFLKEWLDYHIVVGVDHFYLYNNNSTDDYKTVLQPYIAKGMIDLIDWPQPHAQMAAYKDCYEKHKNDTQWIGFIDLDEFICPLHAFSISEWLTPYLKYPSVAIYWKQFGSNGLLEHDDSKLVIEQYTSCWDKLSSYTKVFCNTNFHFEHFTTMHAINAVCKGVSIPPVNEYRKFICFGVNRIPWRSYYTIQLNHYWNKAYDIFYTNKVLRSDAHYNYDNGPIRMQLLYPHESRCVTKDHTIHRFLLAVKMLSLDNTHL